MRDPDHVADGEDAGHPVALQDRQVPVVLAEHVTLDDLPEVSGLETSLAARAAQEIIEFDRIFMTLYCESYSWNLWGAAYVINGGCSDDGFDYFRAWLIAMGRSVFERAVRDRDAEVVYAIHDPAFDLLRRQPRFATLEQAIRMSAARRDMPVLPFAIGLVRQVLTSAPKSLIGLR